MIFRQIEEIKQGKKTQTRRIQRPGESLITDVIMGFGLATRIHKVIDVKGRLRYRVGTSYAIVPKRGAAAISSGRIVLDDIRAERLQSISHADACFEGVSSVEEYKALWESINGKTKGARWDDNPLVWVLQFEYQPSL